MVFIIARHLSLFWARSFQSVLSHPTSCTFPFTPRSFKWSISFMFSHQNPVCSSPVHPRATWPTHLICHVLVIRITFNVKYRSWSSSLCSLLYSDVTQSLLDPKISSVPYSRTPSTYVPPSLWETNLHTHTKYCLFIYELCWTIKLVKREREMFNTSNFRK